MDFGIHLISAVPSNQLSYSFPGTLLVSPH
jgi:hypothetical protein